MNCMGAGTRLNKVVFLSTQTVKLHTAVDSEPHMATHLARKKNTLCFYALEAEQNTKSIMCSADCGGDGERASGCMGLVS